LSTVDVVVWDIGRRLGAADLDDRRIWYFGGDYAEYLELRAALGESAEFQPVGEAIDAVASRIAPDLIELDARITSGLYAISWLASDLGERSPFASPFCLELCRAIALVDAARLGGRHFVLVDDRDFGMALAALCRHNGISAQWHGPGAGLGRLPRAIRAHAGFLRAWFRQRRAVQNAPCRVEKLAAQHPWLMSWAESEFAPGGDRHLGKLADCLRQTDFKIGWLYNPVSWLYPIEAIAAAVERSSRVEPAALVGQFLRGANLLLGYARLMMFPLAIKRRLSIAGVDVTRLLRQAMRRELASPRLVAAALYERLARSLARRGLAPRALFYTFENQPWEKVMLAGFRRALPRTLLVGVQHAPLAERHLCAHPSRRQWLDGTTPDLLVTIGEAFRERLLALGAPAERIAVGGALRHTDLLANPPSSSPEPSEPLMLVTCSMEPRESLELAYKAIAAVTPIAKARLVVNFHPMIEEGIRAALRTRLAGLVDCSRVEFVDGVAAAWLGRAHVLIYSASSTGLEAAIAGVPAVFVGSDIMLDTDPMAGAQTPRCRSPEELRRQIVSLLSDSGARDAAIKAARTFIAHNIVPAKAEFWTALAKRATNGRFG
jgi:surface carbohydrate biosynthesis protein (TIGR04326 family)